MTASAAAAAAVIATTECWECGAKAGQPCRGRYGRPWLFSAHSARRERAKRYRKANPRAYSDVVQMARELSRAEYVEHFTAAVKE